VEGTNGRSRTVTCEKKRETKRGERWKARRAINLIARLIKCDLIESKDMSGNRGRSCKRQREREGWV
jgi:hypothetical protein